jgi:hypothetical protein
VVSAKGLLQCWSTRRFYLAHIAKVMVSETSAFMIACFAVMCNLIQCRASSFEMLLVSQEWIRSTLADHKWMKLEHEEPFLIFGHGSKILVSDLDLKLLLSSNLHALAKLCHMSRSSCSRHRMFQCEG